MPDILKYDFYECENCQLGFAVEENEMDEPCCPSCQSTNSRFVVTRAFVINESIEEIGNCVCCEKKAQLALDDGKFICDSCAQDMSDRASEQENEV